MVGTVSAVLGLCLVMGIFTATAFASPAAEGDRWTVAAGWEIEAGYHIVLIGHENHPEVIGTMGQLPKGSIDLVQNEAEAKKYKTNNYEKLAYITQTTLSVDDTKEIINILKSKFSNIKESAKEDICYATTNRQMAVKKKARRA